jgi:streptogramin lyase
MKTSRVLLGCILALVGLLSGSAGAQIITEFSAGITPGASPTNITAGPDGNLWFTEPGINRIGRITPAGVVTEFSAGITAGAGLAGITAGPDGNLWFTEQYGGRIGRITPTGIVTEFSTPICCISYPTSITAGPDGNLWFTEFGVSRIGRITPAGVVTDFFALGLYPRSITSGPDGNLWFTDGQNGHIGRITPDGIITEFSSGAAPSGSLGAPYGISAGPDGNLWFTKYFLNQIGRITPAGVVTVFRAGITNCGSGRGYPGVPGPIGIAAGSDGNLWFTESHCGRVGRITPDGVITEFSAGITARAGLAGITAGPDGNLWFAEPGGRIGRITFCCYTPVGSDVDVDLGGGAGAAGDVSVTFAQVTGAGNTVLSTSGSCPAVPAGFALGTPAVCYQLTTTAVYTPPVQVCIDYSGSSFGPGPIVLLHYEGGTWVDVTTSVDTTNEVVCGDVDSFSPFVVAATGLGVPPSITTLVSSVNPSRLGRAVVFTASVAGNFPTGTVQFMDGKTPLGSLVTLSGGGIAQLTISTLAWGTHAITAVYSGDANNAANTSSVLYQAVKPGF